MCAFGSRPGSQKPGPAPRHLGQGHVRWAARSHKPRQAASGGRPASRQPRRRAPQLRHRPLCSSKKHPSPGGGMPGGPGSFLESHPGRHRHPWCPPPACPVVPKMLTCTIPHQTQCADPHQPTEGTWAERCSSQNPYQGAFLVERTENNKRQRNKPERDRKRVAGR